MNGFWKKMVDAFGDAEIAFLMLFVGSVALVMFGILVVFWLSTGRYAAATGSLILSGSAAGFCVRDYRRGRWSVVSGLLVTIWILTTVAMMGYVLWATDEPG